MALREHDLRPAGLDARRLKAQQADIAWLSARKADFADSACVACGGSDRETAYLKHGQTWMRCKDCRTVYMSPRPSADLLAAFYARSELYKLWDAEIFPASRETRRLRLFRPRAAHLVALSAERRGGTLVEVGAAHGIFCEEARRTDAFTRIVAVEPSAAQADTCRALGFETVESTIENVRSLDGQADVVAAFEVIEHVSDPLQFVRCAARLIDPGGLLVLTTPNIEGFDIATLGAASDQIYPEHVTLFSAQGLARLATRAGLETIEHSTPGQLDADIVRNKVLAGQHSLEGQPFLQHVLIDDWGRAGEAFQTFLAHAGLSSHMWFVARRPLADAEVAS